MTLFGTSPQYLLGMAKFGIDPSVHDLSSIRVVGCTGSALPASAYPWVREHVGDHVLLASISGGTDVVSGFAGSAPNTPVWAGELSAPHLGVALAAYDPEGFPVVDRVGELVVTRPMPSMPLYFWNDPDGSRYREAYFSAFPGVWRHGDWITVTGHGSVIVHGRSDSTLNRNGVRLGSADIHDVVERLPEIAEALVIGAEEPDGGYWMPLFVVLAAGVTLDDSLGEKIKEAIRTGVSPRHVPDDILEVPGIPHTRTGKKLEVPVKRLLQGAPVEQVVNPAVVDSPSSSTTTPGWALNAGTDPHDHRTDHPRRHAVTGLSPLGLAKIAALPFMRQAAAHLGMSPGHYRVIGMLETAGAAGLLLGLATVPLGVAAAGGLTVLMAAAAVVHLRHGDPPGRALPAAVLALTAAVYAGVAIAAG